MYTSRTFNRDERGNSLSQQSGQADLSFVRERTTERVGKKNAEPVLGLHETRIIIIIIMNDRALWSFEIN